MRTDYMGKDVFVGIAHQSKGNDICMTQEAVYKSAPGIGDISARELSRELRTLKQFSSNKRAYGTY